MYLHITPSFNIDRLCKTASVLLFLVYLLITTEHSNTEALKKVCIYVHLLITKYTKDKKKVCISVRTKIINEIFNVL